MNHMKRYGIIAALVAMALGAFANDRQGVMRRIYPTGADSEGVVLFARGGEVKVQVLEAWDIMPSNWY